MTTETAQELGDSAYAARNLLEDDEQEKREAAAFLARVRAPDEDDDADKDGGLGSGKWLEREED